MTVVERTPNRTVQRLIVTGAGGQVGAALADTARRCGYPVQALTRADFDITDPDAASGLVRAGDLVINCAAFTDVDAAETDPETAVAVNATGPGLLARACAVAGARLVHISTDYVFSGVFSGEPGPRPYEVDDATGPLGVYGKSKLAGERAVLDALPGGAHVVRTSWVYTGAEGTDFVAVMRRLAGTDRTVEVVDDQAGSPTYVNDLVSALLELADRDIRPGILHAANAGAASRFDQARAVFADLGADPRRVRPISTAQAGRPAPRPGYGALSMAGSVRAGLTGLRPWREALRESLGATPQQVSAQPAEGGRIPSTP